MQSSTSTDAYVRTPKQYLALNLLAALRVAGPSRAGRPHKLRHVEVMRRTGMSRTTLTPLLDTAEPSARNPDLSTIYKLAQAIGVPPAFLLMTPDDWRVLVRSIAAMPDFQAAANGVVSDELSNPELAEAVMKRCKVHPDRPPLGVPNDPSEIKRLDARNEWRRRCSLILAAMAQPAARGDRRLLVELTALSAAVANEMTPHNPSN